MGYSSGFYFIYLINLFFEAEFHLFILGLGECEEKEIELHTQNLQTSFLKLILVYPP
jgi:hypothetical protein